MENEGKDTISAPRFLSSILAAIRYINIKKAPFGAFFLQSAIYLFINSRVSQGGTTLKDMRSPGFASFISLAPCFQFISGSGGM